MIVENNKIIECTDIELFKYYLDDEWYNLYSYTTFKNRCIKLGTQIKEKDEE